jgi:hypothetical protein
MAIRGWSGTRTKPTSAGGRRHAGTSSGCRRLVARSGKALDKGDHDDAAGLRAELARLGVVVRDQKERQYWRRSG